MLRRSFAASAVVACGLAVTTVATAAPVGASTALRAELHRLRICESGNNYHAHTGNGYYGAYQFSAPTWHGLGFRGRPDHARPRTQDRAARKEHAISGWRAWPSCSYRAHLR